MVGSHPVQSRPKPDVLDRFFSWGESTFCSHDAVKGTIPLREDNLDFVFEHVESLVCREDVAADKMPRGQALKLERDNSLIEACTTLQAKIVKKKSAWEVEPSQRRDGKPTGEKRDVLDYCFDHVESYACGENATGSLVLKEKTHRRRQTNKTVVSPSLKEEVEDEVHLYFRPS
jgi:hypothetical protein